MKKLLVGLLVGLAIFLAISSLTKGPKPKELIFSDFMILAEQGKVQEVLIRGSSVSGTILESEQKILFETTVPENYSDLVSILRKHQIKIEVRSVGGFPWIVVIVLSYFLFVLLARKLSIGGMAGGPFAPFGKAQPRVSNKNVSKVTFKDVAGIDEVKEEVQETIEFLKNPKRFTALGAKAPKGMLIMGPPGCGKTLLARAVAGESGVPFFSASGSEFEEMLVGVGASRMRQLWDNARQHRPCILFIDEIEIVGKQRGAGLGTSPGEGQTLSELLVQMDGFDINEGIILIGATNRPDILDSALLRRGRFDRHIVVPPPDLKGREAILKIHTTNIKLAKEMDLTVLAQTTPGASGADLANLANEAALIAAREGKIEVTMADFEKAYDRVTMGKERKMVISQEEKKIIAYHEAGHALVAKSLPQADPVHKVSIIPRGMGLGVTLQRALEDKYHYSKDYLLTKLCVLLGGRAAEEIVLNLVSTGAGGDLKEVTEIVRRMICEFGMSEKVGLLRLRQGSESVFLGREIVQGESYSEETAKIIDSEMKKFVDDAFEKAKRILSEHIDKLHLLAKELLEKETLSEEEINLIVASE